MSVHHKCRVNVPYCRGEIVSIPCNVINKVKKKLLDLGGVIGKNEMKTAYLSKFSWLEQIGAEI